MINSSNNKHKKISYEELIETHINFFTKYLTIKEAISLMHVNKELHKLLKTELINILENDKNIINSKLTNINEYENEFYINDYIPSNLNKKAMELLSKHKYGHIFSNTTNVPSRDVLLVYRLYFNIINHPLRNEINDSKFWEDCCKYFTQINYKLLGKFILDNILSQKNNCDNNLYSIYKLIEGNTYNITPKYLQNICNTTSIFVFCVKDILDFYGLSKNKTGLKKEYWTYVKIIRIIDKNLEHFKK